MWIPILKGLKHLNTVLVRTLAASTPTPYSPIRIFSRSHHIGKRQPRKGLMRTSTRTRHGQGGHQQRPRAATHFAPGWRAITSEQQRPFQQQDVQAQVMAAEGTTCLTKEGHEQSSRGNAATMAGCAEPRVVKINGHNTNRTHKRLLHRATTTETVQPWDHRQTN